MISWMRPWGGCCLPPAFDSLLLPGCGFCFCLCRLAPGEPSPRDRLLVALRLRLRSEPQKSSSLELSSEEGAWSEESSPGEDSRPGEGSAEEGSGSSGLFVQTGRCAEKRPARTIRRHALQVTKCKPPRPCLHHTIAHR